MKISHVGDAEALSKALQYSKWPVASPMDFLLIKIWYDCAVAGRATGLSQKNVNSLFKKKIMSQEIDVKILITNKRVC